MTPLKEEDAYPADPEEGYGWEKLYSREALPVLPGGGQARDPGRALPQHLRPLGTYEGGREKAPAAISRKVALAVDGDGIEIWGDGLQTRSFTYVDDRVEGIYRIAQSDHWEPLNLSDCLVTIDQLVDLVTDGGQDAREAARPDQAAGVRGRNSDNDRCKEVLGWAPEVTLEDGLKSTYAWIEGQLEAAGRLPAPVPSA